MLMKNSEGGEIVQVHKGHILRSMGRKDRHSKVLTAKGPRDRRVRLAAHTAIQFYDVQDRLGYDRPSKAIDWLINKAKNAIDKLDELPPWNPTDTPTLAPITDPNLESSSGYALNSHMGENPGGDSSFPPPTMNFQDYPHGGNVFSSEPMPPLQFLHQSSVLLHREPLQSSFLPPFQVWSDQPIQQSSVSEGQFAAQDLLQFHVQSEERFSASPHSHH